MSKYIYIVFFAGLIVNAVFAEINEKYINVAASEFIKAYNQLEGIDLFGGPFGIDDFCIFQQNSGKDRSGNKQITTDYTCTKNKGIRSGLPRNFTIVSTDGISSAFEVIGDKHPAFAEINENIAKYGISLKEIPVPRNLLSKINHSDVVRVTGTKVSRENGDISVFSKIEEKENEIWVYYNNTCQYYYTRYLLVPGSGIICRKNEDDVWKTSFKRKGCKASSISDERFVLYGQLPDSDLISIVREHHQSNPGIRILAISVINENSVYVCDGDLESFSKWLKHIPAFIVIFTNKDGWIVHNAIEICDINNQCFGLPFVPFPLHEKLSEDCLAEMMTLMKIESSRDKADILNIIQNVCRFRGTSKNISYVKDIGPGIVEVDTDNYLSHQILTFRKNGNVWEVDSYKETHYDTDFGP